MPLPTCSRGGRATLPRAGGASNRHAAPVAAGGLASPATTIARIGRRPSPSRSRRRCATQRRHWGRFVRTIVEVETDDGYVGLGEMGGGGESATRGLRGLEAVPRRPRRVRLEEMRFLICNPTASLYNNRTQLHAALEFACLDILGQKLGRAGARAARRPAARRACRSRPTSSSATRTRPPARARCAPPSSSSRTRASSRREHGFTLAQAQGRRLPARRTSSSATARSPRRFPGDRFRFDPNGVWSAEQAIRFGQRIEDLHNDYLEDPVYGLARHAARARDRAHARSPPTRWWSTSSSSRPTSLTHGGRRDPARHDLLGRHPALREGRRGLRDVPARRGRALVGRARHPARHDAAPRRGRCPTSRSPPTRTTTT